MAYSQVSEICLAETGLKSPAAIVSRAPSDAPNLTTRGTRQNKTLIGTAESLKCSPGCAKEVEWRGDNPPSGPTKGYCMV
jgi:hypothetical protein